MPEDRLDARGEPANIGHGTITAYTAKNGCRCADCRAANADYQYLARRRRKAALSANAVVVHGTVNSYQNHGCRCEVCRAANTASCRVYRAHRKVVQS